MHVTSTCVILFLASAKTGNTGIYVMLQPMHSTIEDIYTAMIETDRGVKEKVRIFDTGGLVSINTVT